METQNANNITLEQTNISTIDNKATVTNIIDQPNIIKQDIDKCFLCQKKITLMPFLCKCGNYYCLTHRHSFNHNCTYNFIDDNIRILETKMNKVVADKVQKI
jgi:hypothetical protein